MLLKRFWILLIRKLLRPLLFTPQRSENAWSLRNQCIGRSAETARRKVRTVRIATMINVRRFISIGAQPGASILAASAEIVSLRTNTTQDLRGVARSAAGGNQLSQTQ